MDQPAASASPFDEFKLLVAESTDAVFHDPASSLLSSSNAEYDLNRLKEAYVYCIIFNCEFLRYFVKLANRFNRD